MGRNTHFSPWQYAKSVIMGTAAFAYTVEGIYFIFNLNISNLLPRMRSIALICLTVFVITSQAGYVLAAVSAGAFDFWHVRGWF